MSVKRIFVPDVNGDDAANTFESFSSAVKSLYRARILDGEEVYELVRSTARAIVPVVQAWAFNRPLDEAHVDALHRALATSKHPFLMGTLKFVHVVPTQRVFMIDGQHRHAAILKAMESDPDFDMRVVAEIYHVQRPNDLAVQALFEKANNSLSMITEHAPTQRLIDLVNAMCQDAELNSPQDRPNIVDVPETRSRVNRPRIAKKALANAVQASKARSELLACDVDVVVERARQMNAWLSTLPTTRLFGNETPASQRRRAAAARIGFFLNASTKWPPERWLPMLLTTPEQWDAQLQNQPV